MSESIKLDEGFRDEFKINIPPCVYCAHWNSGERTCKAYPEEIPDEIFLNGNPHTKPFDGDNGIVFEKMKENTDGKT